MRKKLIALVVATYNRKPLLKEMLASFSKYHDLNFVIIDDGSTDGTSEYLALAASQNKNIRFVTTPNRGVTAARNLGLSIARRVGFDYIGYFDSDDKIVDHNKASLVFDYLQNTDEDFIWFPIKTFNEKDEYPDSGRYTLGSFLAKNIEGIYFWSHQFLMANMIQDKLYLESSDKFTPEFAKFYSIPNTKVNFVSIEFGERKYGDDGFTNNWDEKITEYKAGFKLEAFHFFSKPMDRFRSHYSVGQINYYQEILEL